MSQYDVIIVGAGHNGLTAGIELLRAGKKVLIVEKTFGPGGQAATRELFPGFKHSVGAWALLVFKEEMIKYLELDEHGFELIRPESSFTVFGNEDDTPFIGYTDPMELANHLVEDHGFDAMQGFQELGAYFAIWKETFDKYLGVEPPRIEDIIANTEDKDAREALMTLNYGSAIDVMKKFFPDLEKHGTILGSLAASAVDGTHMGPYTKGSATSMSYHYCAGDTYDFKIPKGGIGNLSQALEKVFLKYGGEVQYKRPVENFMIEEGAVTGVVMKGGEQIKALKTISTLDAYNTFINKCDVATLPADFVNSVEEIEYTNGYIQIHLTLKELPTFTKQLAFVNGTEQSWLVAYIRSPQQLHEAWKQFEAGEVPEDPAVYCYFPSQLDPTLAPEGHHTCTLFAHYFPVDSQKGDKKDTKNLMEKRMIDRMETVIPNFRDLIMDKAVFTQRYFESNFGITKGDFAAGLLHPGQMFGDRAVPGWADYTTPLKDLYMASGACHPGPGVTCLPGIYGAKKVLDDLAQASTSEVQEETSEQEVLGA